MSQEADRLPHKLAPSLMSRSVSFLLHRSKSVFAVLLITLVILLTTYGAMYYYTESSVQLTRSSARIQGLTKILLETAMELVDADIMAGQPTTVSPSTQFCENNIRLAVIVPFRDRERHLKTFTRWMRNHLHHQWANVQERVRMQIHMGKNPTVVHQSLNVACSFAGFFIMEQDDDAPFNRAWLLNAGSTLAENQGANLLVFHDVDTLPTRGVDYLTIPKFPTQLSAEIDRFGFKPPYPKNAGGVTIVTSEQFKALNGFSNSYYGWGAEDDDFFQRMVMAKMVSKDGPMHRPAEGKGVFFSLEDKYHTARDKRYLKRGEKRVSRMEGGDEDLWKNDGLSSLLFVTTQAYEPSRNAAPTAAGSFTPPGLGGLSLPDDVYFYRVRHPADLRV